MQSEGTPQEPVPNAGGTASNGRSADAPQVYLSIISANSSNSEHDYLAPQNLSTKSNGSASTHDSHLYATLDSSFNPWTSTPLTGIGVSDQNCYATQILKTHLYRREHQWLKWKCVGGRGLSLEVVGVSGTGIPIRLCGLGERSELLSGVRGSVPAEKIGAFYLS